MGDPTDDLPTMTLYNRGHSVAQESEKKGGRFRLQPRDKVYRRNRS